MASRSKTVGFNVSGTKFEVARSTIMLYPGAYLALLVENTERMNGEELFVDRSAELFAVILNFYRTGHLDIPPYVSVTALARELDYMCLDVKQSAVHSQNIGEQWRERTIDTVQRHISGFLSKLFTTEWFQCKMEETLEMTILMGPCPGPTSENPAQLFGTKTARQLVLQILSDRFHLTGRWETADMSKPPIKLEYPREFEYYPNASEKLYQLVLSCNIELPRRKRRLSNA